MPENGNQSQGVTWWIVTLAVVTSALVLGRLPGTVGVKVPVSSPTSASEERSAGDESSNADKPGENEETNREKRLLSPLSKYFGADKPLDLAGIVDRLKGGPDVPGFALNFLIVVVADPLESAISYSFDVQLDTLHRAMAAEDLIPDAFYMPWVQSDKSPRLWRSEPGVLLFRKSLTAAFDDKPNLLLVLLVGEQPTTGIHQAAFRECVRLIGKLQNHQAAGREAEIMVAGTTFTGSAPSLARAIRDSQDEIVKNRTSWPGETSLSFHVLTGAAIGIDREAFKKHAQHPKGKVEFGATVGHVAPLKDELIRYVRQRTYFSQPRIAWLTESVTGFGAAS